METQMVIILVLKGGRIQEASRLLCYAYNNMNLILKLLAILYLEWKKKVASEILYRKLSLNLIYYHCMYECVVSHEYPLWKKAWESLV